MLFLESELNRMSVWSNPLNTLGHSNSGGFVNNVEKSMLVDVSKDGSSALVHFQKSLTVELSIGSLEGYGSFSLGD